MANSYKILGQIAPTANTLTNAYSTDSASAVLNSIYICNQDSIGRFLVYPNPVFDKLFVSFPPTFSEAKISFYNALGQIVFEKSIQNTETSISMVNINSGIYFYKIKCNSFVQTGKIIKN